MKAKKHENAKAGQKARSQENTAHAKNV